MDPNQLRNAADAMANMSPEQRKSMQSMFANMDPNMIANMSKSMGMPSMSAAQIADAQKKMSDGSVDMGNVAQQARTVADNPAMLNQMKQQQASQSDYMTAGAQSLKMEGNELFKAKNYDGAASCYRKAIANMTETGADSAAANTLMKACRLNLARCLLETTTNVKGGMMEADECCTAVIADDPGNLKARYRRGLAREKMGNPRGSLADLKVALKAAPKDTAVATAVKRLNAQVAELPAETFEEIDEIDDAEPTPAAESAAAEPEPAKPNAKTPVAAKAKVAAPVKAKPKASSAAGPAVPPGNPMANPMANPEMMKRAAEEMRKNPNAMAQAKDQMANMDAATMKRMMKQAGMEMSDEQIKMQQDMMKNMSAEDMTKMSEQAAKMGGMPGMGGMGGAMAPGAAPGMPPIDANQMKMAADMMKNMTPEQTKSMMDMAAKMGPMMGGADGAARPGGTPGMPDAAAMQKMTEELTKNPEMMKGMTDMMQNMDPKVIADMSSKSGMPISEEQAKKMTEQMKNVTPEQMEKLMNWAGRAQWAWGICKDIYGKLFGSKFNAAVTVAVLAYFMSSWLWS